MLLELHITDFAIIDKLSLALAPGFNVLTGETGAGKSIIIDAVGALLGGRLGPEFVRSGAEVARIEGVFENPGAQDPEDGPWREYGVDPGDDCIILSRELHRGGRSICRLGGRIVPVAALQAVGAALVDIHGQSEHLSLLKPSKHIDFLDRYGGLLEQRAAVGARVAELRETRRALQALRTDERELARRIDLLRYQIDEIRAAALAPGEEADLAAERSRLQNAGRIIDLADSAYAGLYGGGERRAAADSLAEAASALRHLCQLDPALDEMAAACEGLGYQAEELARSLRGYRDGLDLDPARLEQVEDRLALIHGLKRKYGASIAEIQAYLQKAEEELAAAGSRDERAADLAAREAELVDETARLALALSGARAAVAAGLGAAIEGEMAGLNMPKVRFAVEMRRRADESGITVPGEDRRVAVDSRGIDDVEFLISPNAGEPLKPLARIASGGETSRLMLAMKSILSEADVIATLIFDEIDQGVGGRSGHVVGERLWALAQRHQVLCVTHLPQIAAFGDAHFHIAKDVAGDRTVTRVRRLGEDERVVELAEMLGGAGEPGMRAAEAMLADTRARQAGSRSEGKDIKNSGGG